MILKDLSGSIKQSHMYVIGISEGKKEKKEWGRGSKKK